MPTRFGMSWAADGNIIAGTEQTGALDAQTVAVIQGMQLLAAFFSGWCDLRGASPVKTVVVSRYLGSPIRMNGDQ